MSNRSVSIKTFSESPEHHDAVVPKSFPELDLFNIPIYRSDMHVFNREYERDLDAHLCKHLGNNRDDATWDGAKHCLHEEFWRTYGGPWRYNQVVAWLRVYIFVSQLRGDIWVLNSKRFVRNPTRKQFRWSGKVFEISVWPKERPSAIIRHLNEALDVASREFRDGRYTMDRSAFDAVAPHINWRCLLGLNTHKVHNQGVDLTDGKTALHMMHLAHCTT